MQQNLSFNFKYDTLFSFSPLNFTKGIKFLQERSKDRTFGPLGDRRGEIEGLGLDREPIVRGGFSSIPAEASPSIHYRRLPLPPLPPPPPPMSNPRILGLDHLPIDLGQTLGLGYGDWICNNIDCWGINWNRDPIATPGV